MAFSKSSRDVRLEDNTVLTAICFRKNGTSTQARLDLNDHIGNRNGAFDLEDAAFSSSAREIRLEGSTLSAHLQAINGAWCRTSIDLDVFIENIDGKLVVQNAVDGANSLDRPSRSCEPVKKQDKSTYTLPRHEAVQSAPRCDLCKDWPKGVPTRWNKIIEIYPKDLTSAKRWKRCQFCLLADRILQETVPQVAGRRVVTSSWLSFSPCFKDSTSLPSFDIHFSTPDVKDETVRCLLHAKSGIALLVRCVSVLVQQLTPVIGDENVSAAFEQVPPAHCLRGESTTQEALAIARTWLDNCVTNHSRCPSSPRGSLPARVLDLGSSTNDPIKLKTNLGSVQETYACLSHCWGKTQTLTLTRRNHDDLHSSIPEQLLQETYTDAIRLCRSLGVRYLWIDTLCIIQDSKQDWEAESRKMCSYYGDCFVCIAATSSADHEGGCRVHDLTIKHEGLGHDNLPYCVYARPKIPHLNNAEFSDHSRYFPLLTRAWVYQERKLSPRVLHATNMELFFECNESISCECGEGDGGNIGQERWTKAQEGYFATHRNINQLDDGPFKTENQWRASVRAYSSLNLTKMSDRLPALSGLAELTRRQRDGHSVPTGRYLAGCWEGTLINDLAWVVGKSVTRLQLDGNSSRGVPGLYTADSNTEASNERPREFIAPSWSWASVLDQIKYAPFGYSDFLVHVEDARIELATTDQYGQVKSGSLLLRAKLRPSRWASKKAFLGGHDVRLLDIEGTTNRLLGLRKDKGVRWWRDFVDGEHCKLTIEEQLYLMPLASRKVYGNGESAEFRLKWLPGMLTTTETMFLVVRPVEYRGLRLHFKAYERIGCAVYSGITDGPDFTDIDESTIMLT